MSTRRKFTFPFATLTSSATLLGKALIDPAYKDAMTVRLGADFITAFPLKITAVTGGTAAQSGQTGDLSTLTDQQEADFKEMERLAAGARRSARLASPFPARTPSSAPSSRSEKPIPNPSPPPSTAPASPTPLR